VVFDERGQILSASLADYVVPGAKRDTADHSVASGDGVPIDASAVSRHGRRRHIGAPAAIANCGFGRMSPLGIEDHRASRHARSNFSADRRRIKQARVVMDLI